MDNRPASGYDGLLAVDGRPVIGRGAAFRGLEISLRDPSPPPWDFLYLQRAK
jgi:hypothetical protein